jgi:hypothetical protein
LREIRGQPGAQLVVRRLRAERAGYSYMTERELSLNGEHAERTTTPSGKISGPFESLARRWRAVVSAADRPAVGLIGIADRGDRYGNRRTGQESRGCRAREHPVKSRLLGGSQHDELRVLVDGG